MKRINIPKLNHGQHGNCQSWSKFNYCKYLIELKDLHSGVMVITTAQLHLTKPELRFCPGSNPACGRLDSCNDKNLHMTLAGMAYDHLKNLHMTLAGMAYDHPSVTTPQKQFIIIFPSQMPNKRFN